MCSYDTDALCSLTTRYLPWGKEEKSECLNPLSFACLQSDVKHRNLLQVRSCRIRPLYDLDNLVEVITLISFDSVFFT